MTVAEHAAGVPCVVPARDGFELSGWLFEPSGPALGGVVIAPAIGTAQGVYAPYADFLRSVGFSVLTFDQRGIGASRPARLRGFPATLHGWGEEDLSGALRWMKARSPSALFLVAHSAGGQLAGLADGVGDLSGFLAVTSPSAYWRHWPAGWPRTRMFLGNYLVIPALNGLLGYLPTRWVMGSGEDLPSGVASEWARWSRAPDYVLSYARPAQRPGFDALRCPMLAYAFEDDPIAPPEAVRQLLAFYPNARSELRVLSGKEHGRSIGHFGFFRRSRAEPLWKESAAWLRQQLPSAAALPVAPVAPA